jgi:hypothetical protein
MVHSRLLFVSVILLAAFCARMAGAEILIGVAGPMMGRPRKPTRWSSWR